MFRVKKKKQKILLFIEWLFHVLYTTKIKKGRKNSK